MYNLLSVDVSMFNFFFRTQRHKKSNEWTCSRMQKISVFNCFTINIVSTDYDHKIYKFVNIYGFNLTYNKLP